MEDDVFDDYSTGAEIKENGGPGFPVVTGNPEVFLILKNLTLPL